jgi:hypothetical protein
LSIEYFIIGILVTLLLAQHAFYMFTVFQLTNRLMSRNYQDFATGERLKKPTNASKTPPKGAVFDPIAEKHAKEANSLFFA